MLTEQQVLEGILANVRPFVELGIAVPCFGTAKQDLGVVATGLLRKGFLQASAISLLASSQAPESAIPNLRSLCEAAGELLHLFEGDNPNERGQLALGFSLREIRDFYKRFGDDEDAEDLEGVELELDVMAQAAPSLYARVEKLGNYWTTTSRAQLVDSAVTSIFNKVGTKAPNSLGHMLYKMLSWDEHHVMAAGLTIGLNKNEPGYGTILPQTAPEDPETFLPIVAAMFLDSMLNAYRDTVLVLDSSDAAPAT